MTKMAMSRMTRLRLSPKKAARDFSAGTFEFCRIRSRYSSRCGIEKLRRLFIRDRRAPACPRDFSETVGP
jgi:hypothetical protein